jgi:uracil-DNA glycosylase
MKETYLFDFLVPGSEKPKLKTFNLPQAPQTLDELCARAAGCSRCALRRGAARVVFGQGSAQARLMLVGEGPGEEEDRLGFPFVGEAGQLLNRILDACKIAREEVYITNVVKCRPPANRTPLKEEITACRSILRREIDLLGPAILVCLGAVAARALIDPEARVSAIRGRWYEKDGIRMMATYHPAALLREAAKKKPTWEDFQIIRDVYRSLY